ncbi:M28 family peptidase [Phenylobacterium sp.]|jgi:Zn-dependent M28 family amino/carboxypeptidase|uniref:M28 family peptidase n=1 Tax=Phenylobacterium sp. TaxID=1871053 RepID=UPI002E36DAE0|nr:M28 family peptidase [Phenylobacterium sp.]HEX3367326.1 M28 family peptidase [Phenylobacterium sp.]
MSARTLATALVLAGLTAGGASAAPPRSAGIKNPDTKAWWQIAEALSSDAMEGRDIGSAGYDRAADIVAAKFKAAGLKPAGDNGGWFQVFPVHESRVETAGTSFTIWRGDRAATPLKFLHEITVRPTDSLPAQMDGELTFRGYCGSKDLAEARGKVVVCFNTKRTGLPTAGQRVQAASAAGAAGLIQVDDPYFTIEPPRWPAAYARAVAIVGTPAPAAASLPVMTLSAEAFKTMLAGSGQNADTVLKAGGDRQPLTAFDLPGLRLKAQFHLTRRDYTAKNVIGVLPGRDPKLSDQYLALTAHLDGYGYGEPVGGDNLYNGALDDAAYVGTLIRFADKHKAKPLRRSVVIAAFTGEEKGLLGAHWFVDHPTVPKAAIVADINLDQLRPLFPLELMTELAVDDTTLGRMAREVAASMAIRIQPDPEPERSLLTRADHWPFMQAGIPGTGFIFGYVPGTEAERRYREWYQVRYHRPQDDLTQPMDFEAAGKFNRFFYRLAESVADADDKPTWLKAPPAR